MPADPNTAGADDWVAPSATGSQSAEGENDWLPAGSAPKQPESYPRDIARGVGRGLISGSGMVLGFPSDAWKMLDRGYQWALTKGAEKMGLISPEDGAAMRAPAPGEEYQLDSEHITRHLYDLAKKLGADADTQPRTTPGKAAETVSSFLPGAASTASRLKEVPGALAKYGVIPGATSEAAGEVTEGTPLEPYARVAGAMAPMAPSLALSAVDHIANPMGKSMAGLTAAQSAQAQALLDQSRAAGAPLTVAEAIQQATGSGTRIGDVQRVVEQSPEGGARMRPFFAERPGQVENLGRSALDQVSPAAADPYAVAPRVQAAANQTVKAADQARSAAVQPFYRAAASDTVPVADMDSFLNRIDTMIGQDKTGIVSPVLTRLRDSLVESPATATQPRVPITDIENLDRARKYFRDQMDLPAWAQGAIPKEEGAKIGSLLGDLRGMMVSNSPDFAAGKAQYQAISENTMNPLIRSPTGQLAGAEAFDKQAGILFNPNPLPGSERAIGRAVQDVARTDPQAAQQLVRQHLEKVFNEATQNNLPGANQFGGPKFTAVVAGNTQQAKNLQAAITALPNGQTRWTAFSKAMEIMEAMGKRQPVGSQTEYNKQINQFLQQGHPAGEVLAAAASPVKWTRAASDLYHNFSYGRNTSELARVFTEGDVKDLRQLVGTRSGSLRSQAMLVGILAREGAGTNQQSESPQP